MDRRQGIRGIQVVIHGLAEVLIKRAEVIVRGAGIFPFNIDFYVFEGEEAVLQAMIAVCRGSQTFKTKVQARPVVGRKNKIAISQGVEPLNLKITERYEVAERLAHPVLIHSQEFSVHPVVCERAIKSALGLSDFVCVVNAYVINSAGMNIKRLTQIFCRNCRTLNMPAGKALSPQRSPAHDVMLKMVNKLEPKNKIRRVSLSWIRHHFFPGGGNFFRERLP